MPCEFLIVGHGAGHVDFKINDRLSQVGGWDSDVSSNFLELSVVFTGHFRTSKGHLRPFRKSVDFAGDGCRSFGGHRNVCGRGAGHWVGGCRCCRGGRLNGRFGNTVGGIFRRSPLPPTGWLKAVPRIRLIEFSWPEVSQGNLKTFPRRPGHGRRSFP